MPKTKSLGQKDGEGMREGLFPRAHPQKERRGRFVFSRTFSWGEVGRMRFRWATPDSDEQICRVGHRPLTIHIIPTKWEDILYERPTMEHCRRSSYKRRECGVEWEFVKNDKLFIGVNSNIKCKEVKRGLEDMVKSCWLVKKLIKHVWNYPTLLTKPPSTF